MSASVLLDATPLASAHALRGIGAAVSGLLSGFRAIEATDRVRLLTRSDQAPPDGFSHRAVEWRRWKRYRVPDPWPLLRGERAMRRRDEPIFHATHPGLVPRGPGIVVTVYDLIPAIYWNEYLGGASSGLMRRSYSRYLNRVAAADLILTISEDTAEDVERMLDVPRERIRVTPLAAPRAAEARGETPDEPFVLYAGGLEHHKNTGLALHALAHGPRDLILVMVGPWSSGRLRRLQRIARRLGVADRVRWRGHVDPGHLSALRRDARALIVPSRKEGFGLPVLEAMRAGTPVLASDIPVFHEVAGDAAIYAPLDDPATWGLQLEQVHANDALRDRLRRDGPIREATFTWERTARATLMAYDARASR